jgi:hypothetical protein
MNKLAALIILLSLCYKTGFSQDYMNKILEETCNCVKNIKDTTKADQYQMALGFCMLNAASPYKKEIKKDYGINMDKIESEGEELGRIIGMKMAGYCPDVMTKLINMFKDEEKDNTPANLNTITGIITKVETETFVIMTLQDDSGKSNRLYWLSFIETKSDITNNCNVLIGKHVSIDFEKAEYFDPKIKEYRLYYIIKTLKAL